MRLKALTFLVVATIAITTIASPKITADADVNSLKTDNCQLKTAKSVYSDGDYKYTLKTPVMLLGQSFDKIQIPYTDEKKAMSSVYTFDYTKTENDKFIFTSDHDKNITLKISHTVNTTTGQVTLTAGSSAPELFRDILAKPNQLSLTCQPSSRSTSSSDSASDGGNISAGRTITLGVGIPQANSGKTNSGYDYKTYVKDLYGFALKLGSALTILMLMFAGYRYMTAGGNSTATSEAQEIMLGAILGYVILLTIGFILQILSLPNPAESTSSLSNLSTLSYLREINHGQS